MIYVIFCFSLILNGAVLFLYLKVDGGGHWWESLVCGHENHGLDIEGGL